MNKPTFVLVLVAAALVATGCASMPQESSGKPNIVLILTDDMRFDDLEYMPKTQNLIADQGVKYSDAFVTTSLCCPSRSSILRGQYAHNHQIMRNGPPEGGFAKFRDLGEESSTAATWLHDSGYKTLLIGKYLNAYNDKYADHIPPGWDEWYAYSDTTHSTYYDYNISEDGKLVHYGSEEQDYLTDVEAEKAKDFIRRSAEDSQPLFMFLAPSAPHGPYTPAPRHEGMFGDAQAPRPPSFDEADVSDKPGWVRKLSHLGTGGDFGSDKEAGEEGDQAETSDIDQRYRERLQTLQAVDDMVEGVINELSETGRLQNTYLVFTSDNGYFQGEHRISGGKGGPYEESIRVPLAVRGPDIPAGRTTDQMALNIDLGPTFADLAGATLPSFVDGRSLKPTFASDAPSWRTAFLEEFWRGQQMPKQDSVRTSRYKYVDYPNSGEHELYDLESDPYELENYYSNADQALIDELKSRLDALNECAGDSCRAAEDGQ